MNAPIPRALLQEAPTVKLQPNLEKVLDSIAYVILEGCRDGMVVTQYDIVKTLFLADKAHLNRHGRPITFDNYVAMKHGPVPSLAYDLLKKNGLAMQRYKLNSLPWQADKADDIAIGCMRFHHATYSDRLAPSEAKALRQALTVVNALTFKQIRELTHSDPAYKEAWAASGDSGSSPMSLALFYDVPNFEAAEEIAFASQQMHEHGRIEDDFEEFYRGLNAG